MARLKRKKTSSTKKKKKKSVDRVSASRAIDDDATKQTELLAGSVGDIKKRQDPFQKKLSSRTMPEPGKLKRYLAQTVRGVLLD